MHPTMMGSGVDGLVALLDGGDPEAVTVARGLALRSLEAVLFGGPLVRVAGVSPVGEWRS